jgi:ATP-dependent DNA helicase RecG
MIPWPKHRPFSAPLASLPGIGKIRLQSLKDKGLVNAGELLRLPPGSYQDKRQFGDLSAAQEGQELVFRARITSVRIAAGRYLKAVAEADGQTANLWWFQGLKYYEEQVKKDRLINVYGVVKFRDGQINFTHPDIWPPYPEGEADPHLGIKSLYEPIGSFTSRLRQRVVENLVQLLPTCPPILPEQWLKTHALKDPVELLGIIHSPPIDSKGTLPRPKFSRAYRSLCTYELMFWRLIIIKARAAIKAEQSSSLSMTSKAFKTPNLESLFEPLPFAPSPEQRRVTLEILDDLFSPIPMNRLLQGEVGCGKTAVAAAAVGACLKMGRKAALMAPTGILAKQLLSFFNSVAQQAGYRVFYLTGNQSPKEKKAIQEVLSSGEPCLTIGTQALASPALTFENLGLAVIDEQHRFGVRQRMALRLKSPNVNLLTMSATPIPASLAGIIYGDTDISSIKGRLPGRTLPKTMVFAPDEAQRVRQHFAKLIRRGEQGFLVYPRIGEDSQVPCSVSSNFQEPELTPSETAAARPSLSSMVSEIENLLPDFQIGILHSRLPQEEKNKVMERFRTGELRVLASTTMVEVGVDVPNANIMLVEGAEYYGLAQLHQLRGRVGRGGGQAKFLVLPHNLESPFTQKRLEALAENSDGYALAELDLKLRGPGEELGLRQSGWPRFEFAKLPAHLELLPVALELAQDLWDYRDQWSNSFTESLEQAYNELAESDEDLVKGIVA